LHDGFKTIQNINLINVKDTKNRGDGGRRFLKINLNPETQIKILIQREKKMSS